MILFIFLPICAFSDIYIWTDANGVKHVSDRPPRDSEVTADMRTLEVAPPPPPKEVSENPGTTEALSVFAAQDSVFTGHSVMMYTQNNNIDCINARKFFLDNQIQFIEFNLNDSEIVIESYKNQGGQGMPLIIIDGTKVLGWDKNKVKALLNID